LYSSKKAPTDRIIISFVSELDPISAIPFFADFECTGVNDSETTLLKNKRVDSLYIYLNGGPRDTDYGWRTNYSAQGNTEPEGKRVFNYVRNCLRLGMFPCFVHYCIPAGGESYWTNKENYVSADYMLSYFKDLQFALDLVNQEGQGIETHFVLEPDMLSYIMQNEPPSSVTGEVEPLEVVMNLSKVNATTFPELTGLEIQNNLIWWTKAVNRFIKRRSPQVTLMHSFGLWMGLDSRSWERGLERGLPGATQIIGQTAGEDLIKRFAIRAATFLMKCGVMHDTDIISCDRYGLDAALVDASSATKPQESRWFFNHDGWASYYMYVSTIAKLLNAKLCLWQQPCGYINQPTEISPYTNQRYPVLPNVAPAGEDGAPVWLYGGSFTRTSNLSYFAADTFKQGVTVNGSTVTWPDMTDKLFEDKMVMYCAGAGVGASTTNSAMGQTGSKATDNYYGIVKAQEYLRRKYTK